MSLDVKLQAETAAERKARHLRQCQDLTALGMVLARAAAARAEMAFAQLPSGPEQEAAEPNGTLVSDPATIFNRMARVVRHAIMLEHSIAAGRSAAFVPDQSDPRRAKMRLAIWQATEGRPDRAELREEADDMLDEELALDPDGTASLADLLDAICDDLDLDLDEEVAANLATPDLARCSPDQAAASPDADEPDWPSPGKPSGARH